MAVSEAAGSATFTVTLDAPSGLTVTVHDYATASGSATSGADFTATSGSIFAPGETSKTVTVAITNDGTDLETFTVDLSNAANLVRLRLRRSPVIRHRSRRFRRRSPVAFHRQHCRHRRHRHSRRVFARPQQPQCGAGCSQPCPCRRVRSDQHHDTGSTLKNTSTVPPGSLLPVMSPSPPGRPPSLSAPPSLTTLSTKTPKRSPSPPSMFPAPFCPPPTSPPPARSPTMIPLRD
ncbi:MAG: Calx-beta domain-containing protein [Verrucomicrobiales bacterium]